jgi:small subunit ribosomal protein S17
MADEPNQQAVETDEPGDEGVDTRPESGTQAPVVQASGRGATQTADAVGGPAGPEPDETSDTDDPAGQKAPTSKVRTAEATSPEIEAEAAPGEQPETVGAAGTRKRKRVPRALRPQRLKPKREKPKQRMPIVREPKPEKARGRRQIRQGTVVSAAMDKTIVVRVDLVKAHPVYKKVVRRSTKFHVHDEGNQAKVGDIVRIVETRPVSRMKRWRLQEILEAAK